MLAIVSCTEGGNDEITARKWNSLLLLWKIKLWYCIYLCIIKSKAVGHVVFWTLFFTSSSLAKNTEVRYPFQLSKSALPLLSWRLTMLTTTTITWNQNSLSKQYTQRSYSHKHFPESNNGSLSCPASPDSPHRLRCCWGSVSSSWIQCRQPGRFESLADMSQ